MICGCIHRRPGVAQTQSRHVGRDEPSIAALSGGGYVVAFQENNGHLAVYSSLTGVSPVTSVSMEKGTSPSIAALSGGGFEVTLQGGSGDDLWLYSSATETATNTYGGMLAGTSPSIASFPGGGYVAAFQNNSYRLAVWASSFGFSESTTLAMKEATSPSIAATSGGYEAAAVASNGTLALYSSTTGRETNIGSPVLAGTSPSIAE
jgi:hypothetical protein